MMLGTVVYALDVSSAGESGVSLLETHLGCTAHPDTTPTHWLALLAPHAPGLALLTPSPGSLVELPQPAIVLDCRVGTRSPPTFAVGARVLVVAFDLGQATLVAGERGRVQDRPGPFRRHARICVCDQAASGAKVS
jgi:hypothetical protein